MPRIVVAVVKQVYCQRRIALYATSISRVQEYSLLVEVVQGDKIFCLSLIGTEWDSLSAAYSRQVLAQFTEGQGVYSARLFKCATGLSGLRYPRA